MKRKSISDWQRLADRRVTHILRAARSFSNLARRGPQPAWHAEVQFVNRTTMTRLNEAFRKNRYPTDILSFSTLKPFWQQGLLGELVICLPILKGQAKFLEHSPELELEVLLVHGVLHLLGLNHEIGKKEARQMAKWEGKILKITLKELYNPQWLGLIERASSGN